MYDFADATNDAGSLRLQAATVTATAIATSAREKRDSESIVIPSEVSRAGGRRLSEPEPIHQIVQRRPADAQEFGGLRKIAVDARQHAYDGALLRFVADLAQVQ